MAPSVWLARHGETEWSRDGRHTSTTDPPLTDAGVAAAGRLGEELDGRAFALVLTSPRLAPGTPRSSPGTPGQRSTTTSWSGGYGELEGADDGDDPRDGARVDRLDAPHPRRRAGGGGRRPRRPRHHAARAADGDTLLFGHSHCLRALAARWLGQPVADGRLFRLDTATVSVLGYERETPVLTRWNA